jgi:hypothetical protein
VAPTSDQPDLAPSSADPTFDGGGTSGLEEYAVYAHSSSALYRVDPDTLKVTLVGNFGWPLLPDQMTDIAIDKAGNMVGVSTSSVYAVSTKDAKCTRLSSFIYAFNALSFVPGDQIDGSDNEILVGASVDGSFYRVDPKTGAATLIGQYGGGLGSSGDIVSVKGFGTVATVSGHDSTDWLARINPQTGAATLIGSTGVSGIWGLGFWKNKVFGFTSSNQFVLINPNTGASTLVQAGQVSWWGAGVSTSAPVIQ